MSRLRLFHTIGCCLINLFDDNQLTLLFAIYTICRCCDERTHRKIEDVEATLDTIRDQIEDHEEVSLALSEGIGQNESLDMGELENELVRRDFFCCSFVCFPV